MTAFSCQDLQLQELIYKLTQLTYIENNCRNSFLITVLSCQTYFRSTSYRCVGILGLLFCHILRFFIKDKVFILTPYLFSSFSMFDVLTILTFYARSLIFLWTCIIKQNFITAETMPAKGHLLFAISYLYLWVWYIPKIVDVELVKNLF